MPYFERICLSNSSSEIPSPRSACSTASSTAALVRTFLVFTLPDILPSVGCLRRGKTLEGIANGWKDALCDDSRDIVWDLRRTKKRTIGWDVFDQRSLNLFWFSPRNIAAVTVTRR